jgi:hypothetical protein
MILYSTEHKSPNVSLEEAIFRGLPPDNGLYMPTEIKSLPASFFETIQDRTLPEIAVAVCENLLGDSLSSEDIKKIIDQSMTFEAPIVSLEPGVEVLELFHGPSMAFKDFGARFMAAPEALALVLQQMADRGLVFLDASAAPGGLTLALAGATGAQAARADVVLDAVPQAGAIEAALWTLEDIARERGSAIGVVGVDGAGVDRIARFTQGLSARGLVLAPASALMQVPARTSAR